MSRRANAILSGALVTVLVLLVATVIGSPDVTTLALSVAIGAVVALAMWAREGMR